MEPDTDDDSARYGIWPTVAGFALGLVIMALMFGLATGFR